MRLRSGSFRTFRPRSLYALVARREQALVAMLAQTLFRCWRLTQQLSIFERVIVANSVIIVLATSAGWWLTQHHAETYHFLIDTTLIGLTALMGVIINFALLRAAFAPLRRMRATIFAVERGDLSARIPIQEGDADTIVLAHAFNVMLDRLAQMRDEAAGQVLRAQEEERRRLALELHDQTGQSLTALTLHAQAIAQGLATASGEPARKARLQAERLSALAQRTLMEVQSIARQLRPALLDDLGLAAALAWLAEESGKRLPIGMRVRVSGSELEHGLRPSDEAQTALFRVAQEAVTNATRHGAAQRIGVTLRSSATQLTLTIADDGAGFDPHNIGNAERWGLGISGMRERVRSLGGGLTIRSQPGRGCVIRARLPVEWTAAHDRVSVDTVKDEAEVIRAR